MCHHDEKSDTSEAFSEGDALLPADTNRRMFDAIASRYDFLNKVLSLGLDRYWRHGAVRALAPTDQGQYLDVGCGTGDLCAEILRCTQSAHVVGIDPSPAMLEYAHKKVGRLDLSAQTSRFETGDARALPYAVCSFDGVISGFCVRNLTDRVTAFDEMLRVTRPGGRIVVLELTKPARGLFSYCHRLYNRWFVPLIGRMLSRGEAYRYLVDSIEHFPDADTVVQEMERAGMEEVRTARLSGGTVTLFTACRSHLEVKSSARSAPTTITGSLG